MRPQLSPWHRVGRFTVVGVLNTAIDFLAFCALYYVFDLPVIVANTMAYTLGVINSFVLNRYWTFADADRGAQQVTQFARFALVNIAGLGLSNLTMWALVPATPAVAAKLIATGVTLVWNYLCSRHFVFVPERADSGR